MSAANGGVAAQQQCVRRTAAALQLYCFIATTTIGVTANGVSAA